MDEEPMRLLCPKEETRYNVEQFLHETSALPVKH